ncbi:MAG: Lrp/AsnC family transcriptional regulator [archaeon]
MHEIKKEHALSLREKKVLIELLKNCKESDRTLARKLKTSQATITRTRNNLYEKGFIHGFTISPGLNKLGLQLTVFTFLKMNFNIQNNGNYLILKEEPRIIFASEGEGLAGKTHVLVSVHDTFPDFQEFIKKIRIKLGKNIIELTSFFVSNNNCLKQISFNNAIENKLFAKEL